VPDQLSDGVFVGRNFLSPFELVKLLSVLDRLSPNWVSSETLGLLGRGGTEQVRSADLSVQALLDEVRRALAPAALHWARSCGFRLPAAPHLQLFPVRMIGDPAAPARQEPHVDSYAGQPRPPLCTNVFYAKARAIHGGDLSVARNPADLSDALVIQPAPNTIVSFAGDRIHWVQPLLGGERVSVVINFY
jgi:hypothetical protein